jgi:hypothetical protein
MNQYKVTSSQIRIGGVKHKRGDILELDDSVADMYGTRLEFIPAKPKRRSKSAAVEGSDEDK